MGPIFQDLGVEPFNYVVFNELHYINDYQFLFLVKQFYNFRPKSFSVVSMATTRI